MPTSPPRACANYLRCRGTTRQGKYCDKCRPPKKDNRTAEQRRDKQKIYQSVQWKNVRVRVLVEEPFCQWMCEDGRPCNAITTEVDHIVGLEKGGAPFDRQNLQALCHKHHSRKTVMEDGGFGFRRKQ